MDKRVELKISECDGCPNVSYQVVQVGTRRQVDTFCNKLKRLVCLGVQPHFMPRDCPLPDWEGYR